MTNPLAFGAAHTIMAMLSRVGKAQRAHHGGPKSKSRACREVLHGLGVFFELLQNIVL